MSDRTHLKTVEDIALKAGQFIESQWNHPNREMEYKGEVDLVTEVDKTAESMILEELQRAFPNDQFIAEESGVHGEHRGRTWFIDPLDGTTNFAHGFPHFCVSIGLIDPNGSDIGVVYQPVQKQLFSAQAGFGATLNGRKIRVSKTPELSRSLLATGFPYDRWTNPDNNSHRAVHLLRHCQGLRRAGAAALDLAYVAAGWLDGYWEDRLKPWDCAAGLTLVREAGGQVTNFRGETATPISGDYIATNGVIHDALKNAVHQAPLQPVMNEGTDP